MTEDASPESLLEHLNLLNNGRPTNAAVLLFGKSVQRHVPNSEVRCAHFHGTGVAKPIPAYQVYHGTVFDLVDRAADFVLDRIDLSVGTRAESVQAPVSYEIPKEVIVEAIVNAVAHRDYASAGSVQVMLFKDRLEIRNPGTLPTRMTLDKLRVPHSSVPTNPLLAHAMYLVAYVERMGTGTLDMIRRCSEAGLPEPEFAVAEGFVTTIRRRRRGQAAPAEGSSRGQVGAKSGPGGGQAEAEEHQVGARSGPGRGQVGAKSGPSRGQAEPSLSTRDVDILRAAVAEPASRKALLVAGRYSRRSGSFGRRIRRLVADGLLEMTLPSMPTSPAQRYRLTGKGRSALSASRGLDADA